MKLILFGDIPNWNRSIQLLQTYRPDIFIAGLSSISLGQFASSSVTYTPEETAALYQSHQIDGVINIQGENPYYFRLLEELGIKDIYVIPHTLCQRLELSESIDGDAILYPYKEVLPELMQIEFHLADHCNLNRKGCSHFSNLVPQPIFPDKEQFVRDLHQLAGYFSQIHDFYLLGGEPLLNPEIGVYIRTVREAFPYTNVIIVTNGLLLLTLKEEVIQTIKENRVHISISDYACLDRDKIISFIQAHALSADLREGKECFSKYLNPRGDSDKEQVFSNCIRRNCTFLAKGKMAACCQPFVVHYFNDYFHENLPEEEGIDLYEPGLTGWEIQKRLITPMESCRYCSADVPFDWAMSKAPYSKDDWCVN